jgi:hypothetical protein
MKTLERQLKHSNAERWNDEIAIEKSILVERIIFVRLLK